MDVSQSITLFFTKEKFSGDGCNSRSLARPKKALMSVIEGNLWGVIVGTLILLSSCFFIKSFLISAPIRFFVSGTVGDTEWPVGGRREGLARGRHNIFLRAMAVLRLMAQHVGLAAIICRPRGIDKDRF